jgi:hypothetical protein
MTSQDQQDKEIPGFIQISQCQVRWTKKGRLSHFLKPDKRCYLLPPLLSNKPGTGVFCVASLNFTFLL